MKKKITVLIVFLCIFNSSIFAELLSEKGFIADLGWKYKDGGVVLNGKKFYYVADSYREQKGWMRTAAGVTVACWLYDTYTYHNGDGSSIYNKYLPEFWDSCRYTMQWDKEIKAGASDGVKALLKERNCDVAIFLIMGWWYVVNYDKSKNTYTTEMFQVFPY